MSEQEIRTVPLSALEHDPVALAGQEKRLLTLGDLLASIPAQGLNQSLRVRPWDPARVVSEGDTAPKAKGKKKTVAAADVAVPLYGVIAGNRRLATLRKLRDMGASIQGVPVTDDWPVPVIIKDEDDAGAFEITSAENVQRLPLTPVEEFRAFKKMADTASVREIADRFGVPEKRVQQRLKLASLHPDVLTALEADKISMAAAEAFSIEPDPERQAAYLKKSKDRWDLEPRRIKEAFTDDLVRSDSPVAKLIGKKAYVAAGGELLGDVFGDAAYWVSTEIIDRLVEEHWAAQKAAWLEEGWLFVETTDEFGKDRWGTYLVGQYDTKKLAPEQLPLPDEQAAEIATLKARGSELGEQFPQLRAGHDWGDDEEEDDSPEFKAAEAELGEILRRVAEIERDAPRLFTAAQKAVSGVVYWPDGQREATLGVVRRGTKLPKELGGRDTDDDGPGAVTKLPASLDAPGDARVHELSRVMTKALQAKVAGQALPALQILVAALHVRTAHGYDVPVKISGEMRSPDPEFAARGYDIGGNSRPVGKDFPAALDWAAEQDIPVLLIYLAELVGPNVGVERHGGSYGAGERALIDFVDPSLVTAFAPDDYFAGVTKPIVALAYADMTAGDILKDGKKGEMAALAAAKARETGWLPPQLRTPSYLGPADKKNALAAPTGDDGDRALQAAE